jgi:hypothetical protein
LLTAPPTHQPAASQLLNAKKSNCHFFTLARMQKKSRQMWAQQLNTSIASWILLLAKIIYA